MGDSPPSYTRFSMPSNQSVPAYTECALRQERVLNSAPASPVPSNEPGCRECAYRTDHVEVILRHVPWGLQFAGYGKGAFVDGTVRFIKNCGHVLKVSVKVFVSVIPARDLYVLINLSSPSLSLSVSRASPVSSYVVPWSSCVCFDGVIA